MLIVLLFLNYAHINLCHFFSSSWCQGLAATSACGSSWTFLFTFLHHILTEELTMCKMIATDFVFTLPSLPGHSCMCIRSHDQSHLLPPGMQEIIFHISPQNHMLVLLIRIASTRQILMGNHNIGFHGGLNFQMLIRFPGDDKNHLSCLMTKPTK